MPYISEERRDKYGELEDMLACIMEEELPAGDLNYIISRIMVLSMCPSGMVSSYTRANTIIGVLECAKMELYRRFIVPYEDKSIINNGDIF